ncbi:MAG: HDOD domain-containing protein, partial [Proteobacteria bacterium]|nr:HDOD domain-containing protein [Pseudomonadota bacterium]
MEFLSRIASSKKLPSLPQILLNLIEVCSREDSTIDEISQIINSDPPLSAKVMGMVNSVYYSLPGKVTTIEHAIVLLGTDAVKNIAISSSIYQVFGKVGRDSAFKMKLFWWHSLMCATMAKLIAERVRNTYTDEAFLSGLLHDIGKLIIWVHFPEEYADILRSSEDRPDLLLEGEKRLLGGTHCEVGAWMINQWKLQASMAEAVLYHHEQVHKIMEASPLAKVIFVANVLSSETLEKNTGYKVAKEVWGFTPSDVDEMLSQAREEVKQTAQLMEIEIESPDISDRD